MRISDWSSDVCSSDLFRILAHNGEINTLKGNVNWMQAHECRMASETFADHVEDLKPVISAGLSDSAALDAVAELMVRAGRDLPMRSAARRVGTECVSTVLITGVAVPFKKKKYIRTVLPV